MTKISVERNQLPAGWRAEKIADIGQWASGGTPSIKDEKLWNGDIPWISAKDMKISRIRDAFDHVSAKAIGNGTRLIPPGSLLMVVRGMILAHTFPVALAESPLAFNQDLKALIPREDLSSEYLLYWFQANKETILSIADEATHGTKRIPTSALFNLPIHLPPPNEQHAISSALSDMDALLAKLDQLIAKKRDIKQAAMQELLTGKRRLPGFSDQWQTRRLDSLADIQRGASPRPIDDPIWYSATSQVGWVRISDLSASDGRKLISTRDYLSQKGIAASRFLPTGSLIMSICASIGLPVVTRIDTCIHDGFVGFTRLRDINQEFLYYKLKEYEPIFKSKGQTGSQSNINSDLVRSCEILLPPVNEQFAIAEAIADMDTEITALEARREKTRLIKQGMMQELLSGRVRLI